MSDKVSAQINDLRSTLGKIDLALSAISDAIVWVDDGSRIQWCNESFDNLLGRPRISLLGESILELMPLEEHGVKLPRDAHPIAVAKRTRADKHGYYTFIREGQDVTLEIKCRYAEIGSSEPFTVGVIRDVTKTKDIEQIKLQSAALKAAANAIVITDSQGYVIWSNRAFSILTQYSLEEIYGKRLSMLKSGKHDQAFYYDLWRTISSGNVWKGEIINRKKDGSLYTEQQMITPVRDEKGLISHFIAIKQDISDKKASEAALHRAKEDAEQANKAKSEFLANMSHEIRTPMNSIMGFIQIILDEELTAEQRDMLETANKSAERLLQLINEILDLSKIEAHSIVLEQIPFVLDSLVLDAVNLVRPRIEEKEIVIQQDFQLGWRNVIGDPTRLRQVLLNLLGNAVKFTEQGEILVRVKTIDETEDRISLEFTVTDTGIGIPSDKLESIFDAFTQVDGSITRKYGGTGLGLTISQRLIKEMGGHIRVESELGKGSIFGFTLWFDKAQVGGALDMGPVVPKFVVKTERTGRRLGILLAEDDLANQKMTTLMLQKMGHTVELAENGAKALEMGQSREYDIILMDIQMPVMGGEEATQKLRQAGVRTPIIAMTGSAMKGDRERFLAAGIDDYISKPIKKEVVLEVLNRHTHSKSKSADSARVPLPPVETIAKELGLDQEEYREILRGFIEEKKEDMRNLAAAFTRGDTDQIHRLAHKIKGSALNLRLDSLARAAGNLEKAAKAGNAFDIENEWNAISQEFEDLGVKEK